MKAREFLRLIKTTTALPQLKARTAILDGERDVPLRSRIFTREELAQHARGLAWAHRVKLYGRSGTELFSRFEDNCVEIERAYFAFANAASRKEAITHGAEWLLDNYPVVEQQVRDIRRHLPRSYYRTLPKLVSEECRGLPRVYHIALETISHADAVVDADSLSTFIHAYQSHSLLTIGELWAVPIMLRLALIENLRRLAVANLTVQEERHAAEELVEELLRDSSKSGTDILLDLAGYVKTRPDLLDARAVHLLRRLRSKGLRATLTLQWLEERLREKGIDPDELVRREHQSDAANQISIANTVISLKTVNTLNWRSWFESMSRVDAVLVQDPLGIYPRDDFLSRDLCRHRIERLARALSVPEVDVAGKALELAGRAHGKWSEELARDPESPHQRFCHVGYYLVDEGLAELENELKYRPPLWRRCGRFLKRHAFTTYSLSVGLLIVLGLIFITDMAVFYGAGAVQLALLLLLFATPLSTLAISIVQWMVTRIMTPFMVSKLDFENGVSDEHRTLVVVHAIFNDKEAIGRFVEHLEVRYLGNQDPNIFFALLADLPDAPESVMPGDNELIEYAEELICELNSRYQEEGRRRFYLLFRKRLWNEKEGRFMGWERKRGKVHELNRMILGQDDTTFMMNVVDLDVLRYVRYVITLDGDSQLTRGAARKMIGAMAHPLNRPVFDEKTGLVTRGYGVIQPRVGISLGSANTSHFSRIFSGNVGLDPYTSTVSDVYQDLFEEGLYLGKAIYDVNAFEKALANRVPENALLSHDLFEGLFTRVALATDVEILDEFPSRFNVFSKRQHRWVRGDWQLLPWMFPRVPNAEMKRYATPFSRLNCWKLVDNLRRSMMAPACFLIFLLAWLFFPGPSALWSGAVLLVMGFPIYSGLVDALLSPPIGISVGLYLRGVLRDFLRNTAQLTLSLSFVPYQAYLIMHAVIITLWRLLISRRNLLEWETAYSSERRLGVELGGFINQMLPGWVLTALAHAAVYRFNPAAHSHALPFLCLWYLSPFLAWWVSRPLPPVEYALNRSERGYLTRIAWRTWCYFNDLMTERSNFLVPDNIQLVPSRVVAERTSPTNIGLSLLSIISAYDFGFIPMCSVIRKLERVVGTLSRLEKFRGHFLNWYQTATLAGLYPRYVSTVDSGNFASNLLVVKTSLPGFLHASLVTESHFEHLVELLNDLSAFWLQDSPELLRQAEILRSTAADSPEGLVEINRLLAGLEELVRRVSALEMPGASALREGQRPLESLLGDLSEFTVLRELFAWQEPLQEFSRLLGENAGDVALEKRLSGAWKIIEGRPLTFSLLAKLHNRLEGIIRRCREEEILPAGKVPECLPVVDRLAQALALSRTAVETLISSVERLRTTCSKMLEEMDFNFLFDHSKSLFVIGYNVDEARRDASYYDLLASEARTTSLLAIAMGQIPQKHWFALGRSLADSPGGKVLLSWSGTMFEYLMPLLVTRDFPGTLLSETYRAIVRAQIIYGRRRSVPWGVSESGYSGVDFEKTYQYRAFGVPGLGLKRGLSEDLVISPYSTFLALMVNPREAIRNIYNLEKAGLQGEFGFYEAIDYTRGRLSSDEESHVIKSFLAHHQGMTLVSLNNFMHAGIMQHRFHSDPAIKSTELLLQERFPERVPAIVPHQAELSLLEAREDDERAPRGEVIRTSHTRYPRTRLLSNGRYSVLVGNAGSGWSFCDRDTSLTRWREDISCNNYGFFIFVRDLDSGQLWSAAFQPTRVEPDYYEVLFNPDKVEFKRRDFGIALQTEITISPEDNVEVRRVTVKNLSSRRRSIEMTSYAEVVLGHTRGDSAHPCFSKMFVESEFMEEFDALLFSRRPRSANEQKLFLFHMITMGVCWGKTEYET